jgi:hypothetical protein
MNAYDWSAAATPWNELGPEFAEELKRIATAPLYELRALKDVPRLLPRVDPEFDVGDMPTIHDIQSHVCRQLHISRAAMLSPRRDQYVCKPRQIAMYLARELTGQTREVIGRAFDRDSTTVWHAEQVCNSATGELAQTIARLRLQLTAQLSVSHTIDARRLT